MSVRRFLTPTLGFSFLSALAHASVIVTTLLYSNRSVSGGAKEVGIWVESWTESEELSSVHSHRVKRKAERVITAEDGEESAKVSEQEEAGGEDAEEIHHSAPGTVYGEEEVDSPVKLIRPPTLRYPPTAFRDGVEGEVELFLIVDEQGHVVEMETVHESNPVFNRAAQDAAKTLQFAPALKNKTPVRVHVHWTCRFRID